MLRAERFTRLSIVLLVLLLPGLARGQYVGFSGPSPVAPAPDVSESSTFLSEEQSEPQSHIHSEEFWPATPDFAPSTDAIPSEIEEDQSASDDAFTLRA